MSIIDFFYQLFNKEKDDRKIVIDERNKIKNDISQKFKTELGFTDLEVREILDIATLAEVEIEEIKIGLVGVNVNNPNTERDVEKAVEKINEISKKMYDDITKKAQFIMERKKEYNKSKQKS